MASSGVYVSASVVFVVVMLYATYVYRFKTGTADIGEYIICSSARIG